MKVNLLFAGRKVNGISKLATFRVGVLLALLLISQLGLSGQDVLFQKQMQDWLRNNQSPTLMVKVLTDASYNLPFDKARIYNTVLTQTDFTLDTVIVYSAGVNPKRYIYGYSDDYYVLSTLLQVDQNGEWKNSSLENCSYDTYGNLLSTVWQEWQNNTWLNSARTTYTYSTESKLLTFIRQNWVNNNWQNNIKVEFTYDTYGNVVAVFNMNWENGEWANSSHEIYTYDLSGNMLTAFLEVWLDSVWVNSAKYTYTYNPAGNRLTSTTELWDFNQWVNHYYESYTYNASGKIATFTGQIWENNSWINSIYYDYSYNGLNQLTQSIGKAWQGNSWINSNKDTYTYENYGGIESIVSMQWQGNMWENISLGSNTYDTYGNALQCDYFAWENGSWIQNQDGVLNLSFNYSTLVNYYTGYRAIAAYTSLYVGLDEESDLGVGNLCCLPNPVNPSSKLILTLNTGCFVTIELYDNRGRYVHLVYNGSLPEGINYIELPDLSLKSGLYHLLVKFGSKLKKLKLIVI